jgi:hypothetical protein
LDNNLIVRGTLSYETQLVKRPLDMSLSNQKLNALLNIKIPTLEGEMIASIGDYIIRGVQGEYYPCKPDIFEMTYEAV